MAIQLVTFGGLHAVNDNGELDWLLAQHSRAALFVYLAIEQRVSRDALTTVVPRFEQLQKEGEAGHAQLNQYTRYATVAVAAAPPSRSTVEPTRSCCPGCRSAVRVARRSST